MLIDGRLYASMCGSQMCYTGCDVHHWGARIKSQASAANIAVRKHCGRMRNQGRDDSLRVNARLRIVLAMSTDPCRKLITDPSSAKTGRPPLNAPSPNVTAVTCKHIYTLKPTLVQKAGKRKCEQQPRQAIHQILTIVRHSLCMPSITRIRSQ